MTDGQFYLATSASEWSKARAAPAGIAIRILGLVADEDFSKQRIGGGC